MGFGLLICSLAFGQDPLTTRSDTQMEIEYGREAYEQFVHSRYRSKNEPYCNRVNRIVSQLVAAMPRKLYPFQAVVLGQSTINAECLPGGYIVVYEGLISIMPDDNELAFVLAHEIGHGARRHWAHEIANLQRDFWVHAVLAAMTQTEVNTDAINLRTIAFTRGQEADADAYGTELYLRAGFDPEKVSDGMKVLRDRESQTPDHTPYYLRSHPLTKDRVVHIEKRAKELLDGGLKPVSVTESPDLSTEKVFGQIPTLASRDCVWQPGSPGLTWEYEISTSQSRSRYMVKVVGVAKVNGTSIQRMVMDVAGKQISYQVIVDGDRVWRRNRAEDEKSLWLTETIFPAAGKTLDSGKWIFKNDSMEDVETPSGTYKGCLKIIATEEGGRILKEWFAIGVGLVKRVNEKSGVTELLARFSGA